MKRDYKCVAFSCDVRTPAEEVMCPYHWAMVPDSLKMLIEAQYKPLKEMKRRELIEYTRSCRRAADGVRSYEELL